MKENSFFNEEDLTGRDGLPGYWQAKDGCIVGEPLPGQKAHTFLCSKKHYRDFDLKFRVKREAGVGNTGVQFRSHIVDMPRFAVVSPQCEIDDLNFTLPPGSLVTEPNGDPLKVKPSAAAREALAKVYKEDAFNDFHIHCVGKHVTIKVNDVITVDGDFPSLPDEGIIAWQLNGYRSPRSVWFRIVEFTDLSASASADGFVPLFNGKDLTGWQTHPKQPGNWRVEKGVLTSSGPAISHLYSERSDYKDFHLRVEARINDGGNSGVLFRTGFGPASPTNNPNYPLGYEANVMNTKPGGEAQTGSLILAGLRGGPPVVSVRESPVSSGEWFTMEVIAEGNHIVIKVNGRITADYPDDKRNLFNGHVALQHGNPQTVVEFRKIEIKKLPAKKP